MNEEVFVLAPTKEEAAAVRGKNDPEAAELLDARREFLRRHRVVEESELPDVREVLKTERREALLSETDVVVGNLKLRLDANGYGLIELDGQRLPGLQKMTIHLEANRRPRVVFEVVAK